MPIGVAINEPFNYQSSYSRDPTLTAIIDAPWNVNAYHYKVFMRQRECLDTCFPFYTEARIDVNRSQ